MGEKSGNGEKGMRETIVGMVCKNRKRKNGGGVLALARILMMNPFYIQFLSRKINGL